MLQEKGRGDGLARELAEARTRAESAEKAQAELENERSRLEDQTRQLSQEVLNLRIEQAGQKQPAGKVIHNSMHRAAMMIVSSTLAESLA